MRNGQSSAGHSSNAAATAPSVGTEVRFSRGYGGRLRQMFPGERDGLATVPHWEYCDYVEWCAGWFDKKGFAEMAYDAQKLVLHDRNHRVYETVVSAYVHRRKAFRKSCAGIFLGLEHVDMPFISHRDEVEYMR